MNNNRENIKLISMNNNRENIKLISMVLVICSMINSLSIVGLIFWTIGIAFTFTLLDRKGVGIQLMDNKKRRILLGIGVTLTLCSLIDEISIIALVIFAIGFTLTISVIEKENNKSE